MVEHLKERTNKQVMSTVDRKLSETMELLKSALHCMDMNTQGRDAAGEGSQCLAERNLAALQGQSAGFDLVNRISRISILAFDGFV